MNSFGKRLKELREKAGLSQAELARRIGTSRQAIQKIENRDNDEMGATNALRTAHELGVTIDDLVYGKTPLSANQPVAEYGQQSNPQRIPVYKWGDITNKNLPRSDATPISELPCPANAGPNAFGLIVADSSMDGADGYREGWVIYIDPDRQPKHHDDVVVVFADGSAALRLLEDGPSGKHLIARNTQWPDRVQAMPQNAVILGPVIGSWIDRRR